MSASPEEVEELSAGWVPDRHPEGSAGPATVQVEPARWLLGQVEDRLAAFTAASATAAIQAGQDCVLVGRLIAGESLQPLHLLPHVQPICVHKLSQNWAHVNIHRVSVNASFGLSFK